MAKLETSIRAEKRDVTRRALIKWSVAAGAALGVSRAKIFEILEKTAGRDVAFAAAESPTTRSVHLQAGNGGLAWFQLFWPQVAVAKAKNPNFAWHKIGTEVDVAGTARPLVVGEDTPWKKLPAGRQVTCFLAGNNETHTGNAQSTTTLNGAGLFAIASALQSASPSVIPLVTIGNAAAGTAPGAATPSNVGNADGIVNLFNSAASRTGGLLAKTTDADLYRSYYQSFIQLNRASNRPTTKAAYTTADGAAKFLGTNLATQLAITPADMTRYGVTAGTRANVLAIAKAFIIGTKAMKLGLTNAIVMPAMNDDPHGAFDGGDVNTVPALMRGVFDAFMDDLTTAIDSNTLKSLADDITITITGDTPKNCLARGGWPDGSPGNTNNMYVYSSGHLKSGWFGNIDAAGKVTGFDAAGNAATYNGATQAKLATASVAYAIAKRDDRAITNFANGVTVGGVFGNLKDK